MAILTPKRNVYHEYSWGGGGVKVRPARKADNLTAIWWAAYL
jgi:hypothetical protein